MPQVRHTSTAAERGRWTTAQGVATGTRVSSQIPQSTGTVSSGVDIDMILSQAIPHRMSEASESFPSYGENRDQPGW
ncbi:hypothetical protein CH338_22385 [Rhodoplanes elegans]|uniref:Uncharacterized protein n=1 Tax=Rhodoplanes elegans TaxID=29408 RepID=A0A327K792_9BRAD|nr:hypothetical protein CH338_22385 [Rhodoplanes elegans]